MSFYIDLIWTSNRTVTCDFRWGWGGVGWVIPVSKATCNDFFFYSTTIHNFINMRKIMLEVDMGEGK